MKALDNLKITHGGTTKNTTAERKEHHIQTKNARRLELATMGYLVGGKFSWVEGKQKHDAWVDSGEKRVGDESRLSGDE